MEIKLKYKIVKIGRSVEETTTLLNNWDAYGYELVCAYMMGDHLILRKKDEEKIKNGN